MVCDLDRRARQFGEMASRPEFDGMTVDDTEIWLEQQGIPSEFCEKFSGEFNNVFYHVVAILFSVIPPFRELHRW